MKIYHSATIVLMANLCCSNAFNGLKTTVNRAFRNTGLARNPMFAAMVSTSASVENALLQQDSLPKFASIDPSMLTPAVTSLIETLDKDFEAFEKKISQDGYEATYENVMPELEQMQFPIGYGKIFHCVL